MSGLRSAGRAEERARERAGRAGDVSVPAARPEAAGQVAGRATRVLGIGGTLRPGSTSELALRHALRLADQMGATTELITAQMLELPMYDPANAGAPGAQALIEAARSADAVIIATPGYHGNMSGLVKNALDYLQELAGDDAPYLHGRAVGCIVTAAGWQAGVTSLASLRATVHALRAWPTPLGVVINSAAPPFGPDGTPVDPAVAGQLREMVHQVVSFTPVMSRAS
ncbi:MAG TPA: NAD(P)H-dependent oxidoreductase [Trebonia sp.]|jgi:FMN reductase